MSTICNGMWLSEDATIRSLSGLSEEAGIRFSIDLVAAARRHLSFLRTVADSQWLHRTPTILRAIRRSDSFSSLSFSPKFFFFFLGGFFRGMLDGMGSLKLGWFCRYDELWMPFISDLTVGSTPPRLMPPLDIQWVWHCHSLNPVSKKLL